MFSRFGPRTYSDEFPNLPKDDGRPTEDPEEEDLSELEVVDFDQIDVEEELAWLYARCKRLISQVADKKKLSPSQRARALSLTTDLLERIAKVRMNLNTAQRLQRLEQVLVNTMREQPEEVRARFFEDYERELAKP